VIRLGAFLLLGAALTVFIWCVVNPESLGRGMAGARYGLRHPVLFFRYRMWEDEETYGKRIGRNFRRASDSE
jgi:hypothetical protein